MLTLLTTSDAAVMLAGACLLIGWLAGMAMLTLICWRRLTRNQDVEIRLLRQQREDQDAVLAGLYQQVERQARFIVLQERVDKTRASCAPSRGAA